MPPKFSYASALSQPKPAPSPLLRTQPPSTPSTHAPSSSSPARADRDTSRSDLSRGSPKRVQPKPPAKSSPKPPPKMSVANVEPSPKPERPSAGGQGEGPKTPAPQLPSPKAPAASDTAGGEGEPKPKKKKKKAVQLPPAPPPVFVEDDFPSLSRDTGPKRPPKRMPAPIAHSPSTEDAAVYPVSLDRAAATSGSEGDSDWPRVETAPKRRVKSDTEAEPKGPVQPISKKPKKTKMVNLADLIDQLTASKAAGRPVKITNSRATDSKASTTKSALRLLSTVLTRITKNPDSTTLRQLPASDPKVRTFEAWPRVFKLFQQSGFVQSKDGKSYVLQAKDLKELENVLNIVQLQIKNHGQNVNSATEALLHGRRGKERLTKKKKRMTRLKKIVLAERDGRQLDTLSTLQATAKAYPKDAALANLQVFDIKCAIRNAGLRNLHGNVKCGMTGEQLLAAVEAEQQQVKQRMQQREQEARFQRAGQDGKVTSWHLPWVACELCMLCSSGSGGAHVRCCCCGCWSRQTRGPGKHVCTRSPAAHQPFCNRHTSHPLFEPPETAVATTTVQPLAPRVYPPPPATNVFHDTVRCSCPTPFLHCPTHALMGTARAAAALTASPVHGESFGSPPPPLF
uniref:PUB domain-containing protein n=1 Tax=Eutreptiella gymnastica TaxID=73025 RepID=A0A7S4FZB7_9EUGL